MIIKRVPSVLVWNHQETFADFSWVYGENINNDLKLLDLRPPHLAQKPEARAAAVVCTYATAAENWTIFKGPMKVNPVKT